MKDVLTKYTHKKKQISGSSTKAGHFAIWQNWRVFIENAMRFDMHPIKLLHSAPPLPR